ncbi:PREDICTED: pentatricopeptide repeat-containing protein At5g41170, mitochondrial-like [Ipomoea nil]|uniref:pentatricopeptide repeat-containing protein At5g41170, mitochondrial-like n=1 Tax=Ipomoea nil TaxID=35883 RepID=UPI000901E531|nr:PREDICTED: pentatricopeptide repeat-containing protein At5g41170, mitochondrial-like [Ipomoea nil]
MHFSLHPPPSLSSASSILLPPFPKTPTSFIKNPGNFHPLARNIAQEKSSLAENPDKLSTKHAFVSTNQSEIELSEENSSAHAIWVSENCEKNDPETARTVLNRMLDNGVQPNVAMFTTVINSFCKKGRLKQAFEVFESMGRAGCEPTINTYNCLLKGMCYVGRVEAAYETLKTVKKSALKPDIYTYTAVMDGFCKVGRSDEAMELLDEALEIGLSPSVVTYNTLFNGYFKEGRPLDGIRLLEQMKLKNCIPDYVTYSTLLHGLLKWGKIRVALSIYKEMLERGHDVDGRMMNTLLRGLCRRGRMNEWVLRDAYEVFDRMRERKIVVEHRAYELVIEALCNGKEVDKALASLVEMVRIGYSPGRFTFCNVIRALCADGKVDGALSVLSLMHRRSRFWVGVPPYNILIKELNRQGRALDARNVYAAALKRGLLVPRKKPIQFSAKAQAPHIANG